MIVKLFVKDERLRPFVRVLIFAVAVLLLTASLVAIVDAVFRRPPTAELSLSDIIVGEVALAVSAVIVAYILRRYLDRRSIASLGLPPRGRWLRLFGLGIVFGAGMQSIIWAIESASGAAHVTGYGGFMGDVRLLAAAGTVFFAGALFEEMSFRGYALQNLWEEWGIIPAIVVTSVGFAALHFSNPHAREQTILTVADLVTFALWACMSVVWTKSLWLALGAHAAWNLFEGPVFGLPVSGLVMPTRTIVVQTVNGPAWLTGGSFGPEAGVSALAALVVGFLVLRFLHSKGAFADALDTREAYAKTQAAARRQ